MGNIVRIGAIKKGDLLSINTEGSLPVPGTKSYSLPLKLSNISNGIKYTNVPKNNSDKLLVLDNVGNVISKSGYLADYKTSPLLSNVVKDKLSSMRIESDRIKSAVEHGPIYDKLFMDLKRLNVPVEADVYLSPIKYFRQEYNCNPKFKEEVTAFAESQGAKVMNFSPNAINNNDDQLPSQVVFPQKGTIYAPDGEIWNWSSVEDVKNPTNSTMVKSGYPKYGSENEKGFNRESFDDDEVPPLPNYNTHPNMPLNEIAGLNIQAIPGELPKSYTKGRNAKSNNDFNNKNTDSLQDFDKTMNSENVGGDDFRMTSKLEENQDSDNPIVCTRCDQPIEFGEVAVKAERAGDNASWHPQCFTCIKCDQLLADLVYFYHEGEIYCARDLAEVMEVLRCAACDELIFSRPYTKAEERTYHANHFCCLHCDGPLGGKKYVPDDKTGQPICLDCYDKFHAATCHSCKNVIAPHEQGVSWSNFHWHGTCFNCACKDCNKCLLGGRFMIKNEMPFCSSQCVKKTIT